MLLIYPPPPPPRARARCLDAAAADADAALLPLHASAHDMNHPGTCPRRLSTRIRPAHKSIGLLLSFGGGQITRQKQPPI